MKGGKRSRWTCVFLLFFLTGIALWVGGGVLGVKFFVADLEQQWMDSEKVSACSHVKEIYCMFTLPAEFSLHLVKVEGLTWFWVRSSRQQNFPPFKNQQGKTPDMDISDVIRQGHGREDGSQWWRCWWNLRRCEWDKPADLPVENGLTCWWWLYGYAKY